MSLTLRLYVRRGPVQVDPVSREFEKIEMEFPLLLFPPSLQTPYQSLAERVLEPVVRREYA